MIAVLLFAYPLAFRPVDPAPQLVVNAEEIDSADRETYGGEILHADDFTDDERSFLE